MHKHFNYIFIWLKVQLSQFWFSFHHHRTERQRNESKLFLFQFRYTSVVCIHNMEKKRYKIKTITIFTSTVLCWLYNVPSSKPVCSFHQNVLNCAQFFVENRKKNQLFIFFNPLMGRWQITNLILNTARLTQTWINYFFDLFQDMVKILYALTCYGTRTIPAHIVSRHKLNFAMENF